MAGIILNTSTGAVTTSANCPLTSDTITVQPPTEPTPPLQQNTRILSGLLLAIGELKSGGLTQEKILSTGK
jgi:hypothetical protein